MRFGKTRSAHIPRPGPGSPISLALLVLLMSRPNATIAETVEIDGFTEPYRTINVAAADSGILDQLNVQEGETVTQGQILASLDCHLHYRSLAIAEESMKAQGRLKSAKAQLELNRERLKKFEEVLASGHARQEEVERARAELAMAEGNLLAVQEDLTVKTLEYERILAQIERRKIRSPIDGFVRRIVKHEGEYAAPNDPTVLTVVQLNVLMATFSVPSTSARALRTGQQVLVTMEGEREAAKGTIELLDPVTDAESGSVLLKVRIENSQGRYRSGERCLLHVPSSRRKVTRHGEPTRRGQTPG